LGDPENGDHPDSILPAQRARLNRARFQATRIDKRDITPALERKMKLKA
jgi:hypothetical protein